MAQTHATQDRVNDFVIKIASETRQQTATAERLIAAHAANEQFELADGLHRRVL